MGRRRRLACVALLLAVVLTTPCRTGAQTPAPAADTAGILYRKLPFGSQSTFSPLTMFLNVGFEDFLSSGSDRRLGSFPYRGALGGVWDGLRHPVSAVERYGGWRSWIGSEILPFELSLSAGWVANYSTHLVSGALQTRMLSEWYDAHGVPAPRVLGSLTFLAASVLHESGQFPNASTGSATSVADLYLFDVAAAVFGHVGGLPDFMVRRLDAANWAPMVSVATPGSELTNLGDYWVYKLRLPHADRTRFFTRVGYGTQVGMSRDVGSDFDISVAYGAQTDSRRIDPVTLDEGVTLVHSLWASLDRNNSLLASVNVSGRLEDRLIVNVYPGVLPGWASSIGVWLVADANGTTRVGLAHRSALGLGLGRRISKRGARAGQ